MSVQQRSEFVSIGQPEVAYRKLLDAVPGMIYQFRLATDGTVSFPFVSAGCQTLFHLSADELLADATCLISLIYPADRPEFNDSIAHSAKTLTAWKWEGRIQVSAEQVVWVEAASQPELQPNGDILWSGMLMDVTRRKQAEDSVRQLNEELERRIEERTTELNQAIATLEERNRFFDVSQDLLCLIGFDGYFKQLNPQWTRLLGFAEAELQAKPFIEFVHPDDRARTSAEAEKIAQGAITLSFENRYLCKDGSIRWLQWQAVPFIQQQMMYASARDVTDRKHAEKVLQLSESKNRALLTVIPDMMFCYSRDGVYLDFFPSIDWDPAVTPDVFLGKSIFDVLPEDVAQIMAESIHKVLDTGEMQRLEYTLEIGGEPHEYEARVVAFAQDEVLTIVRDISDRKAAEAKLRNYADCQALLNQLTNQIRNSLDQNTIIDSALQAIQHQLNLDSCGLVWFLPDIEPPSWELAKVVEASNQMPYPLGLYPASLVGPIEEALLMDGIICIDDIAQYPEPIHRAFLQKLGVKSVLQVRILLKDGRLGLLAANRNQVKPWNEHEVELLQSVAAQLAIALNQSYLYMESQQQAQELADALLELQRTQMQMIQSEKMSSLGQLVAGVAHEINNPVNFIYGNLSHANDYINDLLGLVALYQQHYPKPVSEILDETEAIDLEFLKDDLVKLLNSMRVGADRIQMIVASLRNFSRMDEAEKKQVNIHEGIDSTLMILQNRIKARHDRNDIKILKEYGDLPLVECYAGQLNQVFMNVLVNAIDALEDSSKFSVPNSQSENQDSKPQTQSAVLVNQHLPTITIRTAIVGANWVRITIADNGAGMPEAVKARIFDPFYTTKPIGKGTGMGMSISYEIITTKHGGTLSCTSETGVGTEFVIQIPIHQDS